MLNERLLKEQTKQQKDANHYKKELDDYRKSKLYKATTSKTGVYSDLGMNMMLRDPTLRRQIMGGAESGIGATVDQAISGPGSLPVGAAYLGFRGASTVNRNKRLAYERQRAPELGNVGKVGRGMDMAKSANRLGHTLPLGYSMMGKGLGLNSASWGGPSMYGMMGLGGSLGFAGAGIGIGMWKNYRMKNTTASKTDSNDLVSKYSVADKFESEMSKLASAGKTEPKDQLYLGLIQQIEKHVSVVPYIASLLDYNDQSKAKQKDNDRSYKSKISDEFSKNSLLDIFEKNINKSTIKYDPLSQLISFLTTKKGVKQQLTEIDKAYPEKSKRQAFKDKALTTGSTLKDTRLLSSDSDTVLQSASTYEGKILNLTRAQLDATLISSKNLVAIRMAMGVEKDSFNYQQIQSEAFLPKMFNFIKTIPTKIDSALSNIPGIAALYNISKLPFNIMEKLTGVLEKGSKFGEFLATLPAQIKNKRSGGLFELQRNPAEFEKELGIYKTDREHAESFFSNGLPTSIGQMLTYDEMKIKLLRNIYYTLKTAHGVSIDDSDLKEQQQIAWDSILQKFLTQNEVDSLKNSLKMDYAKSKLGGNDLLNQIESKKTGESIEAIELRKTMKQLSKVGMTEQDLYQENESNIPLRTKNRYSNSKSLGRADSAGFMGSAALAPLLPIFGPMVAAITGSTMFGKSVLEGFHSKTDQLQQQQHLQNQFGNSDIFNNLTNKELEAQVENSRTSVKSRMLEHISTQIQSIYEILNTIHSQSREYLYPWVYNIAKTLTPNSIPAYQIENMPSAPQQSAIENQSPISLQIPSNNFENVYSEINKSNENNVLPSNTIIKQIQNANTEDNTSDNSALSKFPEQINESKQSQGLKKYKEKITDLFSNMSEKLTELGENAPEDSALSKFTGQIDELKQNRKLKKYKEKTTDLFSNMSEKLSKLVENTDDDDENENQLMKKKNASRITKILSGLLGAGALFALIKTTDIGDKVLTNVSNQIAKHPEFAIPGLAGVGALTGISFGGIPGAIIGGLLGGAIGTLLPIFSSDAEFKGDYFLDLADAFKSKLGKLISTSSLMYVGGKIGLAMGGFPGLLAGTLIGGTLGLIAPQFVYALGKGYKDDGSFSVAKFIKALAIGDENDKIYDATNNATEVIKQYQKDSANEEEFNQKLQTDLKNINKRKELLREEQKKLEEKGPGLFSAFSHLKIALQEMTLSRDEEETKAARDGRQSRNNMVGRIGSLGGQFAGSSLGWKNKENEKDAGNYAFGGMVPFPEQNEHNVGNYAFGGSVSFPKQNEQDLGKYQNGVDIFPKNDFDRVVSDNTVLRGTVGELGPEEFKISNQGVEIRPLPNNDITRQIKDQMNVLNMTNELNEMNLNSKIDEINRQLSLQSPNEPETKNRETDSNQTQPTTQIISSDNNNNSAAIQFNNDIEDILMGQIDKLFGKSVDNLKRSTINYAYGYNIY